MCRADLAFVFVEAFRAGGQRQFVLRLVVIATAAAAGGGNMGTRLHRQTRIVTVVPGALRRRTRLLPAERITGGARVNVESGMVRTVAVATSRTGAAELQRLLTG